MRPLDESLPSPTARAGRKLEAQPSRLPTTSRGARKWTVWLDLQDERRGRPSFCYPVELSGCGPGLYKRALVCVSDELDLQQNDIGDAGAH